MIDIQNEEELQVVLKQNELVIVLFYAKWCSPCKKMIAILTEIISNFKKLKIVKIDIELQNRFSLANSIYIIPKLHYYKNGNVFLKESGLKSLAQIESNIAVLDNLNEVGL